MTTSSSERGVSLGMPQLPAPGYPDDVRGRLETDAREIIARYPDSRSALLPLLHLVQSEEGHVTRTGMQFCADVLGLTTAEVTAVATFYTMYRRKPSGDYQVGVCTNTLCAVMGGDAIFEELQEHLGVGNGETTDDGKVTLEHIECNAACDFAPVVMVNWEFFDNQNPASAKRLVDDLRAGRPVEPTRGARLCTFKETARILAASPTSGPGPSRRAAARDRRRWWASAWPGERPHPRAWSIRGTAARTRSRRTGQCTNRRRLNTSARTTRRRIRPHPTQPTRQGLSPRRGVMTLAPELKENSPEKLLAPVLSAFWDEDRSWTLDVYRRHEGYEGLRKALAMTPDDLIAYVKDSGLRGRGGAGFPTGMKWQFIPQGDGKPHYLVVNADESEPGTCKDIPLLFANPHSLIEGMIIACYAIRSSHAFIYLRGEVVPVLRRLHSAVSEAYAAGYLGQNILGSGLDLELTVHAGAGAYICGEETALLDSLEGRRGQPRLRPPSLRWQVSTPARLL